MQLCPRDQFVAESEDPATTTQLFHCQRGPDVRPGFKRTGGPQLAVGFVVPTMSDRPLDLELVPLKERYQKHYNQDQIHPPLLLRARTFLWLRQY